MKLAIIGFGALGKQIFMHIQQHCSINQLALFDDDCHQKKVKDAFPFKNYTDQYFSTYQFIIALGYKQLENKIKIIEKLEKLGRTLFTFIHPSSYINNTAKILEGCIIYPMCNIDQEVYLEKAVLVNNNVTLSHNCTIGTASYLSPGVVTSGNVQIGKECFIGAGTIISNNIHIGNKVKVGIGSVVTNHIPDDSSVIGNPLKFVNNITLI